ncbi:DUF6138 family protein [Chitinophaga sp. 212800010-3]|uniref:DUF6138 family protein n=1 Tax=unclassified Chitinophaga TaxID=2619133 RepID=UPI002DF2DD79|nr:DUF4132 domain-containing protein [Chitinophaga sp. 212800010-3]
MERDLNYLVDINGNEALLEKFIQAINNGSCSTDKDDAHVYTLSTGERFLNTAVLKYFFQSRPLSKSLYTEFVEKLRKLAPGGFGMISYTIGLWIEEHVQNKFFDPPAYIWNGEYTLKPGVDTSGVNPEVLSFIVYIGICHIKYGASYETVTANKYFKFVEDLGSDEVKRLKKEGSGALPKRVTAYKDANVDCKANDVFATIRIKILHEGQEAYSSALTYINTLLRTDFPGSYAIELSAKTKNVLPIKGLVKCGAHHFFANAASYPDLYPQLSEYIDLAMSKWEWYINLQDEKCAMPSTFAVFALGLAGEQYFDTVIRYMETVDEEHQSIQEKFTVAFVEKYGISRRSIVVYIKCIMSMQSHPHHKIFLEHFNHAESLERLLECRNNFGNFFTADEINDFQQGGSSVAEMTDDVWQEVLYTTFGDPKHYAGIVKKAPAALKGLYEELFKAS